MLKELNIMSVKNRGIYQTCLLMFQVLNCEAPEYLNVFNNVQNANYVLRSNDQSLLEVPTAKTETFKKSFSYSGAALWNSLPKNIKDIDNIKVKLKAWLLRDTPSERCKLCFYDILYAFYMILYIFYVITYDILSLFF